MCLQPCISCTLMSAATRSVGLAFTNDRNAGVLTTELVTHCRGQGKKTNYETLYGFSSCIPSEDFFLTYLRAKPIPFERINGGLCCRTSTRILYKRTRRRIMVSDVPTIRDIIMFAQVTQDKTLEGVYKSYIFKLLFGSWWGITEDFIEILLPLGCSLGLIVVDDCHQKRRHFGP